MLHEVPFSLGRNSIGDPLGVQGPERSERPLHEDIPQNYKAVLLHTPLCQGDWDMEQDGNYIIVTLPKWTGLASYLLQPALRAEGGASCSSVNLCLQFLSLIGTEHPDAVLAKVRNPFEEGRGR